MSGVLLMGLPHGRDTVFSLRHTLLHTGGIAFLVVSSAVGAYTAAVTFPARSGPAGGGPGKRGGRHR